MPPPQQTHAGHELGAHRIIRICERQGIPVLADRAYREWPVGDDTPQTPAGS
jgi:hypothetical protein